MKVKIFIKHLKNNNEISEMENKNFLDTNCVVINDVVYSLPCGL